MKKFVLATVFVAVLAVGIIEAIPWSVVAGPDRDVLLIHTDIANAASVQVFLQASGQFSSVALYDERTLGTPSLATLLTHDAVLTWTSATDSDGTALGNVLAEYVDAGGQVVVATYAYSQSWQITGAILDTGYSPFQPVAQGGSFPTAQGSLDAGTAVQSHCVFTDVTEAGYWRNNNYSNPTLSPGAALLASDTNGNNLIATNAYGDVLGIGIYPGQVGSLGSAGAKQLFVNALSLVCDVPARTSTPTPTTTTTATPVTPTATPVTPTPTPSPTNGEVPCPDFDGDGAITPRDLVEVARRMGSETGDRRYDSMFDLSQDGRIDVKDLSIVLANFGAPCPE